MNGGAQRNVGRTQCFKTVALRAIRSEPHLILPFGECVSGQRFNVGYSSLQASIRYLHQKLDDPTMPPGSCLAWNVSARRLAGVCQAGPHFFSRIATTFAAQRQRSRVLAQGKSCRICSKPSQSARAPGYATRAAKPEPGVSPKSRRQCA